MIFYESTSSTIIGKPQIEKIGRLQLNQRYTPLAPDRNMIAIDGIVSGSEEPNDHTLPTEAYIKTYVENNITSLQNNDLSDKTSFLQIISAPLNGFNYHNFITRTAQKTIELDFSNTPLKFLSEGKIQTCESTLSLVLPDEVFSPEYFAKFNYDTNINNIYSKYSTLFSSVLASQSGWVSSTTSGTPQFTGDYCVAFPSTVVSTDIEYTFVSFRNGLMLFNDQFFDTPRGQFVDLQKQIRTSCKLIPKTTCTAYKLAYLFIVKDNDAWYLQCTKIKPTLFNKRADLSTIIDDAWYFDNMTCCWYTGLTNGLRKRLACFVGIVACGASDVVAAWNMPPTHLINPYNTVRFEQLDTQTINTVTEQNTVNIFNRKINVVSDLIRPELSLLPKCCQCYIYIDLQGNFQIDWKHPYENVYGEYYHPINYWKCVGEFFIDYTYNISNVLDLHKNIRYDNKGQPTTLSYEFIQSHMFANPYREYFDTSIYPCCRHFFAPLNKNFAKNLAFYNITFASSGGNGYRSDILNTPTFATITSSYNDLIMCLEDGRRGNETSAPQSNFGISNGTKINSNKAISSSGARSTATSLIDTNKYAKGGNSFTGFGGNSGNVCTDQVSVAQLPECFINFGTTLSLTSNSLGLAKFDLNFYEDI